MRRLLGLTLVLVLALAAACGDDDAPDPPQVTPPNGPPEGPIAPEPDEFAPRDPEPDVVEPQGGTVDPYPSSFESAEPLDGDDRTLAVQYWSGVAPCAVLDRVDVDENAEEVALTLWIGQAPDSEDVVCIAIAQLFETHVELDSPLGGRTVVDGSPTEIG